ncbi:MAG: molybdenum cofactor guanylyltransferase [Sandarakinorhabdus sp.]|jgi:molybdopterin-guanine dinucleotide biosynthesis protein A|nr:molybdenum cofactor guanylyltransferase [Sandarakinorhabdus sp.]
MDRTAIVIAAGGEARRMGGNKPARLLAGKRLIDHVLDFALAQGRPLALAANSPVSGVELPHLPDATPGIGPISALASGMDFAAAQGCGTVLMVGCDMPFLPSDLLPRLLAALPGHGAALPESGGRLHPMAGLWRVDQVALADYIAAGKQSLWGFAERQGLVRVAWPDGPFANINNPDDLAAAAARLKMPAR